MIWLLFFLAASGWSQTGALGTSPLVARGEKLFAQGCAVGTCHGTAGTAARAPRLRGRTFDREYLLRVIRDGIPNTDMPAWKDRLTDEDVDALAAYVGSLASATGDPIARGESDVPPEARAGHDLFFDATRIRRCGSCHRVAGTGEAVGPDLDAWTARPGIDPLRQLRGGRIRTVRQVTLLDGDTFPAVVLEQNTHNLRVYDLKGELPVLRTFLPPEVQGVTRAVQWRHDQAMRPYSNSELKSVLEFVLWTQGRK
jgi:mono/diheme cytochrome c family protein